MKKIYQQPQTMSVAIDYVVLLSGSNGPTANKIGPGIRNNSSSRAWDFDDEFDDE